MTDRIRVATVQPPVPDDGAGGFERTVGRGLALCEEAARAGARIVCLPEYFGLFGLPTDRWADRIRAGDATGEQCRQLAARHGVTVLHPSLEIDGDALFNTTWVIGPDGQPLGRYRKVHLTKSERAEGGLTAGDAFPVFAADGATFGIITCYDAYFPEQTRILALQGARIVFWPSLQRSFPSELIMLQARSRALDNVVHVVRSSYGHAEGVAWRPGMMAGNSCIVDPDGTVVADLGHHEGFLTEDLDLSAPHPRPRSHGAPLESPRDFLYEDRRPRLYGRLSERQ